MEELTRLMSTCNVNESTIERWITEERVFAEAKFEAPPSEPPSNQKEYEYFFTLQTYYDKRAGVSQRTETSTAEDITWLIDRLEILERECEIVNRWKPNDQKYMYYLNQQTERKRNLLRQQMWSAVVKRQFLLKQMAKYADGQKIAKRLSKQIGRETSIIKKCLGDYNSLSDDLPLLGLHDVLSSHAKFWADKSLNAEDDLALSNRHELIRNFLLVKRAEEEVVLLSSDMENTITYFKEQQRVIEEEIGNLEKSLVEVADDEKLYVCGCICVLKKFSWSVSISLNKATAAAASLSTSCYDQMPDESDVDEDEDDCSDFDEEF